MKLFLLLLLFIVDSHAMTNYLPLFSSYDNTQKQIYAERLTSLGENYIPRTEHLNKDGSPIYVNDLIFEESPYLLQHAHNPVNWQAWSPTAFALAKKENKPIFISIGYATCHWCHVMEHESFENTEIAKYINQHFVAIKVDRERRTAIDAYYMTGVQMMTGHGGWPMSNFTAPNGKPFFGGTYYRPKDFLTLLKRVNDVWHKQEDELQKQAINMDMAINKHLTQSAQAQTIDGKVFENVNSQLLSMHDELQGGFSSAPKFPQEPWLLYLLAQNNVTTNKILQFTLEQMQQGGIYDQIGGGFHRYSVDNEWLAPHFEKMLYNQSQLSEVYTQAAVLFNNPEFKRIAVAILDYVLREMVSEDGVFYSAGDADSEGEEGLFFTWDEKELSLVLTINEFNWLKGIYHFSKNGNFEHRNILNLSETLQASAKRINMPYPEFIAKLDTINLKLYNARKDRIHPLIDDKVITSWNAEMVYSLANTGYNFGKNNYLLAAVKAMDYLYKKHRNDKNNLVRNSLNNKASNINAELEDYAWMITAMIKLYDVTDNNKWLEQSYKLIALVQNLFLDKIQGGFFDNIPEVDIPLSSRIKKSEDGATVAANGQLLIALARYYQRTGDLKIQELFEKNLAHFSGKIASHPTSHTSMLRAKAIYDNGENGNIVYTGNGNVKIASKINDKQIEIHFTIKQGWHINANIKSIESLIPISIESDANLTFNYPKAEISTLTFSTDKLRTFSGNFKVVADINNATNLPINLKVKLQACSDKVCLAPSQIQVLGSRLEISNKL